MSGIFVSVASILNELERDDLLPAIVFRSSRNQCDIDAEKASRSPRLHLPPERQREIKELVHKIIERYEMDKELITSHPQYNGLLTTGVGAHHAGQLLVWRLLLEELMAAGVLRLLVATGTVAAGVDFPARTVVITAHSRRGAEGFVNITSSEFQQMSGRAGRRGKDTVGFCVVAPSPYCDVRVLQQLSKQPPEPLESSYFPGPSTVLNLLRYRSVDGLRYTVERSLASFVDQKSARASRSECEANAARLSEEGREVFSSFQTKIAEGDQALDTATIPSALPKEEKKLLKRIRRTLRQAEQLSGQQTALLTRSLDGLKTLGYLEGENLSTKGYWAANLCTTLVIELAEMIEAGLFEVESVEELVAVMSSITGDPHRQYLRAPESPLSSDTKSKLSEILVRVREQQMPGVLEDRAVLPDASYTALTWLQISDWSSFRSLLTLGGVAEGDAARVITQTAEQLNQLARLRDSHYELSLLAVEARQRLLRPPLTEVLSVEALS